MKNTTWCAALAFAAAVALPLTASAQFGPKPQTSGIWIDNMTNNCLWATVYSGGNIQGRPGWVASMKRQVYNMPWKGVGQQYEVRTEILSTKDCKPQNSQHPLAADINTRVQGQLVYQVAVKGSGRSFQLIRY